MKRVFTILLSSLISVTTFATQQSSDKLIYKSDIIYIDYYPFEDLVNYEVFKNFMKYQESTRCLSSDCWRGYIATWEIVNDSLFLTDMTDPCHKNIKLELIFGKAKVKHGKVFAYWVTKSIKAPFGKFLDFDEKNWTRVLSKSFSCDITKGKVSTLKIETKSDCEIASILSQADFDESHYSLHSLEFVSSENTYIHILKSNYGINWYYSDSLSYYNCYDSVMIYNLKNKYGSDFLYKAKHIADSLEHTNNWICQPEFIGGNEHITSFIKSRLKIDSTDIDKNKTQIMVVLEIDSLGKVYNPVIKKGINEKIDKMVIDIIKQMPDWKPAYQFGNPVSQKFCIALNIDSQFSAV